MTHTNERICSECMEEKATRDTPRCRRCNKREHRAKWRQNNPGYNKTYREINRDALCARDRARNRARAEYMRNYLREYVQKNKAAHNARCMARHARKLNATVPWADLDIIRSYYAAAQALTLVTGTPWEVDHIIPLRGRNVCGLHHQDNLRVIRKEPNRIKRNKFTPSDCELQLTSK